MGTYILHHTIFIRQSVFEFSGRGIHIFYSIKSGDPEYNTICRTWTPILVLAATPSKDKLPIQWWVWESRGVTYFFIIIIVM